jgi:hypothetical protein
MQLLIKVVQIFLQLMEINGTEHVNIIKPMLWCGVDKARKGKSSPDETYKKKFEKNSGNRV